MNTRLQRKPTTSTLLITLVILLASLLALPASASASTPASTDSWLSTYSNPFLGTWESYIPSADASLTFTFKPDGTFDYIMSSLPADEGGTGSGGYTVTDNVMVSFLAFEGAACYTFEVIDNDTISVTEITDVIDGSPILGETAPFTRVPGSPLPESDAPFTLDNPVVGTWDADLPNDENPDEYFSVVMDYLPSGTGVFTLKPDTVFPDALYFVSDNYLITYSPWEYEFEMFTFTVVDADTLDVTEVLSIQPDGLVEYGATAQFIRSAE
ncbi:MAG: hypothetical protein LBH66_07415 [Oscillospiraceae bacterium]|jgi:hypothetical protein|nr:hypothetical protein [Oscillospiraceae bacterium]